MDHNVLDDYVCSQQIQLHNTLYHQHNTITTEHARCCNIAIELQLYGCIEGACPSGDGQQNRIGAWKHYHADRIRKTPLSSENVFHLMTTKQYLSRENPEMMLRMLQEVSTCLL